MSEHGAPRCPELNRPGLPSERKAGRGRSDGGANVQGERPRLSRRRPPVPLAAVQGDGLLLHYGREQAGARALRMSEAERVTSLVIDDELAVGVQQGLPGYVRVPRAQRSALMRTYEPARQL